MRNLGTCLILLSLLAFANCFEKSKWENIYQDFYQLPFDAIISNIGNLKEAKENSYTYKVNFDVFHDSTVKKRTTIFPDYFNQLRYIYFNFSIYFHN
jgi:hypothetical protein